MIGKVLPENIGCKNVGRENAVCDDICENASFDGKMLKSSSVPLSKKYSLGLFDLDGVVYLGANPIEHCSENVVLKVPSIDSTSEFIGDSPYCAVEFLPLLFFFIIRHVLPSVCLLISIGTLAACDPLVNFR